MIDYTSPSPQYNLVFDYLFQIICVFCGDYFGFIAIAEKLFNNNHGIHVEEVNDDDGKLI